MTDFTPRTVALRKPALWTLPMTQFMVGFVSVAILSELYRLAMGQFRGTTQTIVMFAFMAFAAAAIAGVMVLVRLALRSKGDSSWRFSSDFLELPINSWQRQATRLSYEDVLSVTTVGKQKRARLILDTPKHTYGYPIAAFVDPQTAESQIRAYLRERIMARDDGIAQWSAMEERRETAARFLATRPIGTWSLLAAITIVFGLQLANGKFDLSTVLAMGANSSALTWDGQWFRLVTANLLHANVLHFFNNALFALIVGMVVERQIGTARFIIVVVVTGILSQLTSGLSADLLDKAIFSVGVSGALFGILGAQAVLNWRYGRQLPGGYRFAARSWVVLVILNFVLLPLAVPQIDNAAHIGGLGSGFALCWFLCRGKADIHAFTRSQDANGFAAALCALCVVAIVQAALHARDPETREADARVWMKHALFNARPGAQRDNNLAWTVAINPDATWEELKRALELASRAVANTHILEQKQAATDTLATVHYRLGQLDTALDLEEPLFTIDNRTRSSQFARFLDRRLERDGPRLIGEGAAVPKVAVDLETNALTLTFAQPIAKGARMYTLVYENGRVSAIQRLHLTASTATEIHVPPGPRPLMAEALKRGGRIAVAYLDVTGCGCATRSRTFITLDPAVVRLP